MFFLSFASSIRIFTLFLNLINSEKFLILFIILAGVIFTIWKKKKQNSPTTNEQPYNNKRLKCFCKSLLRGIIGNIFAIGIIFCHLYIKNPDYSKQFLGIKNIEYSAPERESFNDFVRITDTQKYHKYYIKTTEGKKYLLTSESDYNIGDLIFLSASKKDLDLSSIFSLNGNAFFTKEFRNYEFNYDKRLFMKGVNGSMYEKNSIKAECEIKDGIENCESITMQGKTPNFEPLGKIDKLRAKIQSKVVSIFGNNKYSGLLLGLFIGDKSMIPIDNYNTFVDSGLVHIIAVSGGNIAMVTILLSFLLSFLPFYIRNGFLILGIIFYAAICGSDASVFRAAVMGILTLIALFRGREISIRRSMMYAFLAILIFNPFSLGYDIGFILSFGAIIGIVLFQKLSQNIWEAKQKNKKRKPGNKKDKSDFFNSKFWKEYLVPTIGASLGTAPILIFFMNGVNLVGIFLNIIIMPIIPIVTIYGFVSLILSLIVQRNIRIRPEKLLMDIIYWLSEIGAEYAIFLHSDVMWKKYILVGLFICLGAFVYLKIYGKPTLNNSSNQKSNNPDF